MSKKKLSTPQWILEGYDSKKEYENAKGISTEEKDNKKPKKKKTSKNKKQKKSSNSKKTFKIKKCPECGNENIKVVVGEKVKGLWKCEKCDWKGKDIEEKEISEEEFLKYLDRQEGNK